MRAARAVRPRRRNGTARDRDQACSTRSRCRRRTARCGAGRYKGVRWIVTVDNRRVPTLATSHGRTIARWLCSGISASFGACTSGRSTTWFSRLRTSTRPSSSTSRLGCTGRRLARGELHPSRRGVGAGCSAPHARVGGPVFLVSDSLDEVAESLARAGVPVELGPVDRTGATSALASLYVRDPDGNLVELSQTIDS